MILNEVVLLLEHYLIQNQTFARLQEQVPDQGTQVHKLIEEDGIIKN